jgi:NADPH-dependent glutamate synthase beta subunit-like oxidoreductase
VRIVGVSFIAKGLEPYIILRELERFMNLQKLSSECLSCPSPRCQRGCPTHNLIRDFILGCKKEDYPSAAKILYSVNPFPELTSLLCDHKRQCQGSCVKGIKGAPVAIPDIEFALSQIGKRDLGKKESNGLSVALVGAGIACLTAAYFLLKEGYAVDIYEKESFLGGAIATGIPSFRFDKTPLKTIEDDLRKLGAVFHFAVNVGKDVSLEELRSVHAYVVLGLGASKNNSVGFSCKKGLVPGLDLLYGLNVANKQKDYERYASCCVWGGGNVALDCARSMRRLGKETTIVYRRSLAEMPGSEKEIKEALEEGVKIAFLTNVKDLIKNEDDELIGLRLVKMELGEMDASHRASCHEVTGSEFAVDCALLISAIGQKSDFSSLKKEIVPMTGRLSNLDRVYLTGDCFFGAKNIASCISDGRECAQEIIAASCSTNP